MSTVFLRLCIIYFITVFSMRLMGKRQIGQMQMSELVCAFFLSELASYPVTNQNVPLTYGIIPVVTLICLEVMLSALSTKIPLLRRALDAAPSALIRQGRLMPSELARARLSVEELLSLLRLKDVTALDEVDYALLEPNGEVSVIPKGKGGMMHLLVADGVKNENGLSGASLTDAELETLLQENGVKENEVFLLCRNDEGALTLLKRGAS